MTKNFGDVLTQPMAAVGDKVEITSDSINVMRTDWGFVVGSGEAAAKRAKTGEDAATAAAIVFLSIAAAQWVAPNTMMGMDLMTFKAAITLVFLFIAAKLYMIRHNGLTRETQIDVDEREIRTVRRSRKRVSSTLQTIRFRDVGKIYVDKVPGGFMDFALYVKPIRSNQAVQVATGAERHMQDMRNMLLQQVRSRGRSLRPETLV